MKELLLNPESIEINQDFEAVPGDAVMGCGGTPPPPPPPAPPPKPATCTVSLTHQDSNHACTLNKTFRRERRPRRCMTPGHRRCTAA